MKMSLKFFNVDGNFNILFSRQALSSRHQKEMRFKYCTRDNDARLIRPVTFHFEHFHFFKKRYNISRKLNQYKELIVTVEIQPTTFKIIRVPTAPS